MERNKCFVDLYEVGDCILNEPFSEKSKETFSTESADFKRGAMWGMSWAFITISANCPRYVIKEVQNESKTDC